MDIFHIKNNEISLTENRITTNVSELQYNIEKLEDFKESLQDIFVNNDNYLLSSISIRVKILNREKRDSFVVSPYIELEVDQSICDKRGSNIHSPMCLMEEVQTELKEDRIRKVTCPHCVNTHISDYILNRIDDIIDQYPLTETSEIKNWTIYRPPDFQNLIKK